MKKLAFFLVLVLSLVACSPKFHYFSTETTCPQCVVDSLLGPQTSNYLYWTGFKTIGINQGDSTTIATYVNSVGKAHISVTTYGNTETATVRKKEKTK